MQKKKKKKKNQTSAHSWDIVNLFLITLDMSVHAKPAITCSKLTKKKTLEKGLKYVQS